MPSDWVGKVVTTSTIPDIKILANKNGKQLRQLTIAQVDWYYIDSLSFTLNDGQSVKAGKNLFPGKYTFDPTKKITKIEVIIGKYEY